MYLVHTHLVSVSLVGTSKSQSSFQTLRIRQHSNVHAGHMLLTSVPLGPKLKSKPRGPRSRPRLRKTGRQRQHLAWAKLTIAADFAYEYIAFFRELKLSRECIKIRFGYLQFGALEAGAARHNPPCKFFLRTHRCEA